MIYEMNDLSGTYPATDVANVMDNTLRVVKKAAPQRFVVTADDDARVDAVLDAIERSSGLEALRLPLERSYHIDLGFDLKWK